MSTINDLKAKSLRALGYTGSIDDMYGSYLRAISGSSLNSVNDLEKLVLGGSGSINDRWKAHLDISGIRGRAMDNMLREYWSTLGAGALGTSYLFRNNEVGVWYDPSDLSTMFQDSVGTTAAVVGQPVGKILDKSGNGYHATQDTSTARPILARHPISGRRNLLTYTEDFSNAQWTKAAGAAVTANQATAPNGELTADLISVPDSSAGVYKTLFAAVVGQSYVFCVWVKGAIGEVINVGINAGSADFSYQQVILSGEWQFVSGTFTATGTSVLAIHFRTDFPSPAGVVGAFSCYAWGAQFELGSTPTAYQKVTSTYDVTEAGVNDAYYLKFDGLDDFMVTPSIDFSGTDKMSVFAGVRKLSDAATGMVVELSTTVSSNNGTFFMDVPDSVTNKLGFASKGTVLAFSETTNNTYLSPVTIVLSGIASISGDTCTLRANGSLIKTAVTDQGTGNFGNYPLYIGMRAGTTLPFNGHMYSLVVRGALSDAAQISAAESYVNSKTGAY